MIVVFVVDNSPSMALPASRESGMSRLDLAKMAVEDLTRQLRKRQTTHVKLVSEEPSMERQRSYLNLGVGGSHPDQLLLLSTARQHPEAAACAAGGRLLVGFGNTNLSSAEQQGNNNSPNNPSFPQRQGQGEASWDDQQMMEAFHRQLKGLRASQWDSSSGKPFPEEAGGAVGLNAALSAGLQLLSRYRLHNRFTENFGLGRLPNPAITAGTSAAAAATGALQPACLIILTDGACLRQPPQMGGGQLQLQYGAQPLKGFYTEPFRWDQRIFCLGVGAKDGVSSTQFLHPQLRAFCEVTGGSHWVIRKAASANLSQITEAMMKRISPPMPKEIPLKDTFAMRHPSMIPNSSSSIPLPMKTPPGLNFVHGGPCVSLQALEPDESEGQQRPPKVYRALLLYVSSPSTAVASGKDKHILSPPLWCIPEAHFPSKKLDTLPPRKAQPHLVFSRYPANLGSKSFEPTQVMKMLQKLDQLTTANRKHVSTPQQKCLHRDTYICEWLNAEGARPVQVSMPGRQEYFPVFVPGAGRPSLSAEEGDNYLNIGILHIPANGSSTLAASANASRLATLTLLPPDPHILIPMLVRAAEAENRVLKKMEAKGSLGKGIMSGGGSKLNVPLDESWRNEIRAYLFRLPPYYQPALRRALRPIMPTSANNLLQFDPSPEAILLQCFSKVCLQKIRQGEQVAIDNNARLEQQEMNLRRKRGLLHMNNRTIEEKAQTLRYGQYDPRTSLDSYLTALRNMPAPAPESRGSNSASGEGTNRGQDSPTSVMDLLGDLPREGLMAFYESRRRWVFGGTGLSTRGLHVEGVNYDGSNSQRCDKTPGEQPECPLTRAGVGVSSVNQQTTAKMGDYRERLLFSKPPIVGYGSNDFAGVAATTAVDGSPRWSVDDDAMPLAFFDPATGEFQDNVQARVRSRLMVNFGNPFRERRADSLIPEKFLSQAPSMERGLTDSASSPPHDSFDSVEEGEAVFVIKSPSRTSPKRDDGSDYEAEERPTKKAKTDDERKTEPPPPPPPPARPETPPVRPDSDDSKNAEKPLKPPPPPVMSDSVDGNTEQVSPSSAKGKLTLGAKPPPPKPPASGPPPPPGKAVKKSAPPPRPPGSKPAPGKKSAPPPRPPGTKPVHPPKPNQAGRPPPPPSQGNKESLQGTGKESRPPPRKPDAAPAPPPQKRPSTIKETAPTPEDLQRPDVKPQFDLPPDWICVWSKSQKRWYFFNTKNNQSVWQWPPNKL